MSGRGDKQKPNVPPSLVDVELSRSLKVVDEENGTLKNENQGLKERIRVLELEVKDLKKDQQQPLDISKKK